MLVVFFTFHVSQVPIQVLSYRKKSEGDVTCSQLSRFDALLIQLSTSLDNSISALQCQDESSPQCHSSLTLNCKFQCHIATIQSLLFCPLMAPHVCGVACTVIASKVAPQFQNGPPSSQVGHICQHKTALKGGPLQNLGGHASTVLVRKIEKKKLHAEKLNN